MNKNFPIVVFFFCLSIMGMLSVTSWFWMWVMLEMNTLTFIVFMKCLGKTSNSENTLTYFMVQAVSSIFFMLTILMSDNFKMMQSVSFIFLISLLFKMGVAPLHLWIIPVVLSSSWAIMTMLMTIQKILPILLLEISKLEISNLIFLTCATTAIVGSISNIASSNTKTIIIFSSISSMSWIILSVSLSEKMWKYFVVVYFFTLCMVFKQNNKNTAKPGNISNFIMLMSIGGMPPFMGFFPKLLVLGEMMKLNMLFLILTLLGTSIMDIFVYLRLSFSSMLQNISKKSLKNQKNDMMKIFVMMNFLVILFLL